MNSRKGTGGLAPALLACIAACLLASPAAADDLDDAEAGYASVAVQNRKHFGTHEFGIHGGVLPMDAFTKGFTLSAAYTLHFSQTIGWEVIQGTYSFHKKTDLLDDLENLNVSPTPFEVVNQLVTSSFVWKPIYWKGALRNKRLIFGEMFMNLGAGYGWFTRSQRAAVSGGIGARVYLTEMISVRIDVRELLFFRDNIFQEFDVQDELWVAVGASLAL